ncbi:MAG: hypothetical protein EG826_04480 [Deltaproteobacteria bacterium]|nr:hypothetical protein [Deltaproteobacteria bacterium]
MKYLKQSTSAVIKLGPFVDFEDGVTLETGLVSALDHASTGIMLSKNGGTLAVRHATVTATTYDAHGFYSVTLDATDTNTLGRLLVVYTDPVTCLAVWQEFIILPANVYDSLYGSDKLDVELDAVTSALAAIQGRTDLIPGSPAAVGSIMGLSADTQATTAAAVRAAIAAELARILLIPTDPLLATDARVDALVSAIAAIPINPLLTDDSRLAALATPYVLPVMQGVVYTATAVKNREVVIVQGDTPRIIFDLGADYTGWTPYFGAKAALGDTAYAIAPKAGAWSDAAEGAGYIDLTAIDTAIRGRYPAEIELRNGTQRLTAMKFTLKIIDAVIKE